MLDFFYYPSAMYDQFKVSFWSNFYAGIGTGIVTGIIVGIILWQMQKRNNKKEIKQQVIREVEVFLQQLNITIQSSASVTLSKKGGNVLPSNLQDSLNLILANPVTYWHSQLDKEYNKEISACLLVLKYHREFLKVSTHLDTWINNRLLEDHDLLNYYRYLPAYYGILTNIPEKTILKWCDMPIVPEPINYLKEISIEKNASEMVESYLKTRDNLLDSYSELKVLMS